MASHLHHAAAKIARVLLRVLGWSLLVVSTLVVLLFAALELPASRDLLKSQVNENLRQLFKGTLVIDRIGSIDLFTVNGIDAHMLDANGRRVLVAKGLSAKSVWPRMLPSILTGKPLAIKLDRVSCDNVEVTLIDDGTGSPTLAGAFLPRNPEPASKPSTTSIIFPNIHVRHVWAHGGLSSLPLIDVELLDMAASLAQQPDRMQAVLDHLTITARSMPAHIDPAGVLKASVVLPSASGASPTLSTSFEGKLLDAPTNINARLQADRLQAQISVTDLKDDRLRQYMPSLTLRGPSSINAQVEGPLTKLHFVADAENPALRLALQGDAVIGPAKTLTADLELTHVNLAQITTAPATNLRLRLGASLKQSATGQTDGTFRIDIPQGEAGGVATPPVQTAGTLHLGEQGSVDVSGNLSVHDPGAYGQLDYQLTSRAEHSMVKGKLSVQFTRPERAERLLGVTASGAMQAEAQVDLSGSRLFSSLLLDVQPISVTSTRVQSLRVRATASGTLQNPNFHVDSSARGVTLGSRQLSHVLLSIHGNADSCAVKAQVDEQSQRRIGLAATVSLSKLTELIEPRLALASEDGNDISVRARRIAYNAGAVRFDQLELTGAGELKANGTVSERHSDLEFALFGLQITRIMRSLGLPSDLGQASLTAEGHVSGPIRSLDGTLRGHIDGLEFRRVRGGNIGLDLSVKDSVATALIEAKLGHSHLTTNLNDLDIPRGPITRHSLLAMRGRARVDGSLDLEEVEPLLRTLGVPVQRAKGQLDVDLELQNPRNGPAQPELTLSIKTRQLKFVEQRKQLTNVDTASAARKTQPVSLEGIDLDAHLEISTREHQARFNASLTDKLGTLAHVTAESKLPDLASTRSLAAFASSPMKVDLAVPERSLDALPRLVRPQGMKGYVGANVQFAGSARDPKLDARVTVRRLKYKPRVPGISGNATLRYENIRGELSALAFSGDRKVAEVSSQWSGNLLAKLQNAQGYTDLTLDSDVSLLQFPVGAVPALADHSIRGVVSCDLRLRGWGKNADLQGHIDGSELTIRNQRIAALQASFRANDQKGLTASVQADQNPGTLHAQLDVPLQWGARLAPLMGSGAKAVLRASQFQVSTFSPLLLPTVSELQGSLDADLKIQLTEGAPHLQGFARLQNATLEIPQVGQRFSDVAARVSINGSEIQLDSLQARGTTGRVTASARAALNGTELQSATARVDISSKEKLPVTFEGVEVGDAWGHIDFSYAKTEQSTNIRVDVPNFHLELPEESMASVQSLDPDPHVQVGIFGQDRQFAAIPVQPLTKSKSDEPTEELPTKIQIHLGDSVWVQRSQQAKVQLSGDLTLTSGEPTRIDGRIDLRGGTLDVSGKTFHIENGTVAFTGADSANPTITATARWDSPLGYAVYAQFAGTAKNGKLTLRAEPQLTQNEIVSLLLFGSPEGALGASAGGGGAAATAVGVAGDTAAKGLNRMINDFTHLDVAARIDTSTGSARPELVVQVTPRLTTRVTRALGEPAPGQSPDRTFLTLELRLRRAWALSGVVGDRGASSLDLIWRHRY